MEVNEIKIRKEYINQLNSIHDKDNNPKEMEIDDIQNRRVMNDMIESSGLAYVSDAHCYSIDINWRFIQKPLFNLLIEQDYFNKSYLVPRNLFDFSFIRSLLLKSSKELIDS
ncbi:hypothetical protein [Coxiella endosymbiont of Ornithodoros maritimus]|uniref:hypothetical protein n=1 Tax=Coxiella endosymbiont of Ornithodoros maritimus TaxID=1656172 RepID=UPI0022644B4F|nr:hypothetical protein [Coxiella endosymbiont of Ornithodoros maritimus]